MFLRRKETRRVSHHKSLVSNYTSQFANTRVPLSVTEILDSIDYNMTHFSGRLELRHSLVSVAFLSLGCPSCQWYDERCLMRTGEALESKGLRHSVDCRWWQPTLFRFCSHRLETRSARVLDLSDVCESLSYSRTRKPSSRNLQGTILRFKSPFQLG